MKTLQKGITPVGLLLWVLVIVLGATLVIKLTPVYMEHFTIKQSLNKVKETYEEKLQQGQSLEKILIKKSVMKYFHINFVTHADEKDVKVQQRIGGYKVNVTYNVKVDLLSNVALLLTFDNSVMIDET